MIKMNQNKKSNQNLSKLLTDKLTNRSKVAAEATGWNFFQKVTA